MTLKKWKTVSSKELLNHPRLRVVEDEVELPNGNVTKYLHFAPTLSHAVAIIAVNDAEEMLLQREYNYPLDKILWQLPGGGIEKGESIIEAALRELSEESGFIAKECRVLGYYYTH